MCNAAISLANGGSHPISSAGGRLDASCRRQRVMLTKLIEFTQNWRIFQTFCFRKLISILGKWLATIRLEIKIDRSFIRYRIRLRFAIITILLDISGMCQPKRINITSVDIYCAPEAQMNKWKQIAHWLTPTCCFLLVLSFCLLPVEKQTGSTIWDQSLGNLFPFQINLFMPC